MALQLGLLPRSALTSLDDTRPPRPPQGGE